MRQSIVRIALDFPLDTLFDYFYEMEPAPKVGMLVEVPFGKTKQVGIIVACVERSEMDTSRLKHVLQACSSLTVLSKEWLALCRFAAQYYLKSIGEVALPALPQRLRQANHWPTLMPVEEYFSFTTLGENQIQSIVPSRAHGLRRFVNNFLENQPITLSHAKSLYAQAPAYLKEWVDLGWVNCIQQEKKPMLDEPVAIESKEVTLLLLNDEQSQALETIKNQHGFNVFLLFGVTGSGKTEVYLQAMYTVWQKNPHAQILFLVPEINLIAQQEAFFKERFKNILSAQQIVCMHSGLSEKQRQEYWLSAHLGQAKLIIGTRLTIFASLPQLSFIIVDEEHDPSYKQQEGIRYSARDLAIWRAKQCNIPIILGSATPSLETWFQVNKGQYQCLKLSQRAVKNAVLPKIRLIDLKQEALQGKKTLGGISSTLLQAIEQRLEKKEQSLIFLNRRGYAPVLSCDACGWLAECRRCSAYTVYYKKERFLCCHHCGLKMPVPKACPNCGNQDLYPVGQGTQKIEEIFSAHFPQAKVLRIDADSTRLKGKTEALLHEVHQGEVDILIGTQMIAKGHDFQRVSLVGVLNADQALFSADFRASERLFAQLMQVSGRAGRAGLTSEVFIQTQFPEHFLFQSILHQDYSSYAEHLLANRQQNDFPPFVYQALLCAEAKQMDQLMDFFSEAKEQLLALNNENVVVYDAVPRAMAKIKHRHRAQLLIESASRAHLHAALVAWMPILRKQKLRRRWYIEIDPIEI